MDARAKRIVGLLLFVAAGAGALLWRPAQGPVHQGRRTAQWVDQALHDDGRSEAVGAVLKIGRPAVPFLARRGLHDKCHKFRFHGKLKCHRTANIFRAARNRASISASVPMVIRK
jgi:hypothetical protein